VVHLFEVVFLEDLLEWLPRIPCVRFVGAEDPNAIMVEDAAVPLAYAVESTNAVGRKFLMKLSLLDRGNYYKGLLVLLRRDRIIDVREKELMLQVGKILDFDKRFCEAAIDDLLSNAHITREPVIFSDERIKECFFRDAVRLALVDECLHPLELSWLRTVAHANSLSDQWFDDIIQEFKEKDGEQTQSAPFEIQRYL
jgi:hypothetical protein